MATRNKFEINGIIDTSNQVFDNIELLATSSGCFVTWDPSEGKWSVIVNEAGSSIFSFDDSNIVGSISVGGSGLTELYNSVQLEFPHKDLRNATDYLTVSLASADRFTNELDNQLNISLNTINDPVQAQIIATQELKQNRVDKIIEFTSDFTANGLKAGDLVDVTNSALDFSSKVFRIVQISEQDSDEGAILYSITALEYDADVYTLTGLEYDYRTRTTGIPSKITNEEIAKQDDIDIGSQVGRLLAANAALGIINSLFSVDPETGAITNTGSFADKLFQSMFEKGGVKPDLTHTPTATEVCSGSSVTINLAMPSECDSGCFFEDPDVEYDYTITGLDASECSIDLEGTITSSGKSASLTFTGTVTTEKTATVTIGGNSSDIAIAPAPDWTVSISPSSSSITEGATVTFNITTTGVPDGNLAYALTGLTASRLTTAASGNVAISSGSGSLAVVTNDDGTYTGDETLTLTLTMPTNDYCGTGGDNTSSVTVLENDTPPPEDYVQEYTLVPVIWIGTYDATDNELKSVTVGKYMYLPVPLPNSSGGTVVPTEVSVTKGNPSTITITDTVTIDETVTLGGSQVDVITSFNSVNPGEPISGTRVSFWGYNT
jgi:hypothetical protein